MAPNKGERDPTISRTAGPKAALSQRRNNESKVEGKGNGRLKPSEDAARVGGSAETSMPANPPDATTAFMTSEELDRAKDLVLDLLGWGVHPEYLIECGVSSHAIYRIFTDLRLRLPRNIVL